ncbi:ABC transporter substrate-binding protein [Phycicoccus sonneratiae]|uniref:ABC transporter substrate-binding protein n=1 Tax=Phycicoccus sonneratiae TaxID=2807628 RepID=A0ABS2CJM4_9MICO|nr:ABC transporter substrate-binding protein [Phycicoccus sonneraticus]MBM6399990.1 ABC transporter substrate-binding protein [Phycicoccus sonneraticus]
MTRRPLAVVSAATALALALAGCSAVGDDAGSSSSPGASSGGTEDVFGDPADPAEVKDGGTLVMALSAEPDQLDPALSRSLYSRYVFHAMCQKLYDTDEKAQIVPQLATDLPTTSEDGLTVTIPVRTGIEFADGTAFDSSAVKASLERELTLPTSARKSELGPIDSIATPDDKTVVITLKTPFAPLTAALTDRAGMIVSPKAAKDLGEDFASAPVCVGPFKFAKRTPQTSIELVKDPKYYDADQVHLEGVTYRIITDASIRAANLRSGDVQVADSLSAQDAPAIGSTQGLQLLQSNSLGYQGLTINVGNTEGVGKPVGTVDTDLGTKPEVRRALAMSIDREQLVKVVFNGLNTPACSPISPTTEYTSDAAQACEEHDPAAAKKLLADAGVTTPVPIEMITSNNPDSLRLAQALQAMVKDGGFDLKITPVEYASLLDQQDRGDFSLLQLGWSGRIDPDANITNFLGTGGSQNVSGYSNASVDGLLDKARTETDSAARRDLYGQVVGLIEKDNPIIYLYRQRNLTGVSDTVKGVQVFPDGVIRVGFSGFAK